MWKHLLSIYTFHLITASDAVGFQWNRLSPRISRRLRAEQVADQSSAASDNVAVQRVPLPLRRPGREYVPFNSLTAFGGTAYRAQQNGTREAAVADSFSGDKSASSAPATASFSGDKSAATTASSFTSARFSQQSNPARQSRANVFNSRFSVPASGQNQGANNYSTSTAITRSSSSTTVPAYFTRWSQSPNLNQDQTRSSTWSLNPHVSYSSSNPQFVSQPSQQQETTTPVYRSSEVDSSNSRPFNSFDLNYQTRTSPAEQPNEGGRNENKVNFKRDTSADLIGNGQTNDKNVFGLPNGVTNSYDSSVSSQEFVASFPAEEYNAAAYINEPAKYDMRWTVQDDYGNDFGQTESRNEEITQGEYHVRLPDSRRQKVIYSVRGDSGFLAEVVYENDDESGVSSNQLTGAGSPREARLGSPTNFADSQTSQSVLTSSPFSNQKDSQLSVDSEYLGSDSRRNSDNIVFFQPRNPSSNSNSQSENELTPQNNPKRTTIRPNSDNSVYFQRNYQQSGSGQELSDSPVGLNTYDDNSQFSQSWTSFASLSSTQNPVFLQQSGTLSNIDSATFDSSARQAQSSQYQQFNNANELQLNDATSQFGNRRPISQVTNSANQDQGYQQSQFDNQNFIDTNSNIQQAPVQYEQPVIPSPYPSSNDNYPQQFTLSPNSAALPSSISSFGGQQSSFTVATLPTIPPTNRPLEIASTSQPSSPTSPALPQVQNSSFSTTKNFKYSSSNGAFQNFVPNNQKTLQSNERNYPNEESRNNFIGNSSIQDVVNPNTYPQRSVGQSNYQDATQSQQVESQQVESFDEAAKSDKKYSNKNPSSSPVSQYNQSPWNQPVANTNKQNNQGLSQAKPRGTPYNNEQPPLPIFEQPSSAAPARVTIDYGQWRPSQGYPQTLKTEQVRQFRSNNNDNIRAATNRTSPPLARFGPGYPRVRPQTVRAPPSVSAVPIQNGDSAQESSFSQLPSSGYGRLKDSTIYRKSPDNKAPTYSAETNRDQAGYSAPKASSIL